MFIDGLTIAKVIALICLAAFLIALVVLLLKLSSTVNEFKRLFSDNKRDIDKIIEELPDIMDNVEGITNKTDRLIGDISSDLRGITKSVNHTLTNVETVSNDITGTVDYVTESIADTATSIKYGVSDSDIISTGIDTFNRVKNLIRK
ncbi:MAG: hypothetical protein SPI59_05315 [Finegoldia sp.]|nr:hypothetical protein [Finegoldia sp.]